MFVLPVCVTLLGVQVATHFILYKLEKSFRIPTMVQPQGAHFHRITIQLIIGWKASLSHGLLATIYRFRRRLKELAHVFLHVLDESRFVIHMFPDLGQIFPANLLIAALHYENNGGSR